MNRVPEEEKNLLEFIHGLIRLVPPVLSKVVLHRLVKETRVNARDVTVEKPHDISARPRCSIAYEGPVVNWETQRVHELEFVVAGERVLWQS